MTRAAFPRRPCSCGRARRRKHHRDLPDPHRRGAGDELRGQPGRRRFWRTAHAAQTGTIIGGTGDSVIVLRGLGITNGTTYQVRLVAMNDLGSPRRRTA